MTAPTKPLSDGEYPGCPICGRTLAAGLEEWDDSPDTLCFGSEDPDCKRSDKKLGDDHAP